MVLFSSNRLRGWVVRARKGDNSYFVFLVNPSGYDSLLKSSEFLSVHIVRRVMFPEDKFSSNPIVKEVGFKSHKIFETA